MSFLDHASAQLASALATSCAAGEGGAAVEGDEAADEELDDAPSALVGNRGSWGAAAREVVPEDDGVADDGSPLEGGGGGNNWGVDDAEAAGVVVTTFTGGVVTAAGAGMGAGGATGAAATVVEATAGRDWPGLTGVLTRSRIRASLFWAAALAESSCSALS